jgi:hypothetical protein
LTWNRNLAKEHEACAAAVRVHKSKTQDICESYYSISLFGWLVADGWCWFVLREEYCWLVAGGWFVVREKYCWLVADKRSEQAACRKRTS